MSVNTDIVPMARPVLGEAEEQAVIEVLRSGQLSLGPRVPEFERRFAERLGVAHASAVSSGTTALHLGLRAVGVGEGDEVVTSQFSFVASAKAIVYQGATQSACGSAPGGSPRSANRFRTPAAASRLTTCRSSATLWSTAVRCASGVIVESVAIRSVTATVPSRVVPPAP